MQDTPSATYEETYEINILLGAPEALYAALNGMSKHSNGSMHSGIYHKRVGSFSDIMKTSEQGFVDVCRFPGTDVHVTGILEIWLYRNSAAAKGGVSGFVAPYDSNTITGRLRLSGDRLNSKESKRRALLEVAKRLEAMHPKYLPQFYRYIEHTHGTNN
jgi:hypothetical protein